MNVLAQLGIVAILLLAGRICLPFLPAFVWALVIYQVGQPLQRRLLLRFSPRRTSLLMLLVVILTIIIPVSLVGGQLALEAASAFQKLEQNDSLVPSAEAVRQMVARLPLPGPLRNYLEGYDFDATFASHAAELGKQILAVTTDLLTRAAKSAGGFFFSAFAFLFLYYFTCNDGPNWYRKVIRAAPASFGLESLLERLAKGASGLFWGVAGTCLAQGITGGIVFLLLGLPSPLLVASLISFMSLIPFIGSAIVWGPFALWLAFTGAWGKALILTFCGIFVIGSMDNVTRPLLTRISGAELSVLTVTLGAIGGLALFGLTGLVVGPLAIETFSWLLDHLAAANAPQEPAEPEAPPEA